MEIQLFLINFLLVAQVSLVTSQDDCPDGWQSYNSKCWYFSHLQPALSWTAAESWCQQNNGHLASFATIDERDWVVQQNLEMWDETRWWIGLNDIQTEGNFKWSDGTPYDPSVSNWKPLEPNNAYLENCVEIWIQDLVNDEQWNDRTCEGLSAYVCKRDPGSYTTCPSDFLYNGGRCYSVGSSSFQWLEAQQECKKQGANLVTIASDAEKSFVQSLLSAEHDNFWIGLSDTATAGTLKWVDATALSYTNWASGQPPTTLPYQGSTCVEMNQGLGFTWNIERCSIEKRFVCERGLKADCPLGWLYSSDSGKCYEFVINPTRVQTWTTAKQICSGMGGGMLKILNQAEETFIGGVLQGYSNNGHPLVYLGASDIGHDDSITWWDQNPVETLFWNTGMPKFVPGRDDCTAIYTGKSNYNWETVTCFEQRAYICELPEGQGLPSVPIVTVEGKCEDTWRHFNGKCYFFGDAEMTQTSAESYCTSNNAHLTSILDANELSFIVGNLQRVSWIGLTIQGSTKSWIDNEVYGFNNWRASEPSGDGTCVTTSYDGEWNDESCANMWPFVCKKDEIPTQSVTIAPPTYIPDLDKCGGDNWISDPSSDRCYKINPDYRNWFDARYACQVGGGDLVAISSPEENEHVHMLIGTIPTERNWWLGGNDLNNLNVELVDQGWEWADGSPFNYLHWSSGEPNNAQLEDCMMMYGNGLWNDDDCAKYHPSICEKIGNMNNIVGPDVTDDNCNSNEACCFKHLGAEYGGPLPDSVMSASTERDQWFTADRGRLNTPADVIITDVEGEVSYGNGHGAWSPSFSDPDKWLQVDLPNHSEVKGIITQGRNGIIQYSERQWVTSFKVSYSQDDAGGKWEFISDENGNPIEFKGNSDQNTQVTNLFPRPVIARHVRCHPLTWKDAPCMRLEYIGCKTSCLKKLGMNSGLIADSMISASSSKSGREPIQARAPVDTGECLSSSNDDGSNYRGWIAKTATGTTCQAWSSQDPHRHSFTSDKYPTADLRNNYCRNPDGRNGPWCLTTDPNLEWDYCTIPKCPPYTPSGWSPSSASKTQYIQVQFTNYFKVAGVTLYKASSSYVTSYYLSFSDDGIAFMTYQDQSGSNYLFTGLDSSTSEYMDILREPVSTLYIRLSPQEWVNEPIMQFELNGCYVDNRITCSDTASVWQDQGSSFLLDCPPGCVEDPSRGIVYGTDIYTLTSAACPAAVHAGKVLNNHGGTITVQQMEGQSTYLGSYRNGITSEQYGPYSASFNFGGNSLRCDEGWIAWQNHCYYLSMKGVAKTWHNARSYCLGMGGDLVSIVSDGENSFVESQIYTADLGGDVWIGFNDLDVENYYQWSDGSPVTMTKWFFDEPKSGTKRCVNMYRFEAYWNDKSCDETLPYMCKKQKELLPPLATSAPPQDVGCDIGWSAFESSCYLASTDEFMFIYANRICEESNAKLAGIHSDFEQAFVYSLVVNTIPPGLGYTSWIGLSAKTAESGTLYYTWENGEPVTYTHWDKNEPNVRFSCAFPFVYKGVTYYECTTYDHPARLEDTPWCSIDPVYRGRWINCDTGYEYGCTYLDDVTGFWRIDICGQNRYYVCEKDRVGYTQPVETTPSTAGSCTPGWYGDADTAACYQINEKPDQTGRATWADALNHCRTQRADLISIHSYQEEQKIVEFVTNEGVYSGTYFWMGLNSLEATSGYEWTDDTPVSYTNWNYGEPNDHNGNEKCVENGFTYYSTWNDLNCDAVRNWICKIPKDKIPLPPPTIPPPGGDVSTECGTDGEWIRFKPSYGLDKCYLFVDQNPKGWEFAQRNCTGRGGQLVAIHSADESTFIISRSAKLAVQFLWIGLKDVGSVDGRSFQWSDNSTVDFLNWANGEPNNYQEQEDCAELDAEGGLWNDDNCGIQNGYICEKYLGADSVVVSPTPAVTGGCPPGFTAYGNKCWMFSSGSSEQLTWYDVVDRCANYSANPATIQNSYEQAFVTSQMKSIGSNIWIGLSARNSLEYVWHDQSELTYTNWDDYEPNGYYSDDTCVEVTYDASGAGKWADQYCYNYKNYACYTMKSSSYPDTTVPPSACPSGYYSSGDACYKLVNTASTRTQAAQSCQAEGADVYLMSINDVYENNLIKSWFWRDITSSNTVWTGMTFTTETSDNGEATTTFQWDDSWPVDYTAWAAAEPNSDALASGSGCVGMTSQGTWVAYSMTSCQSMSMPFVCKQSLTTVPPTMDPGDGNCDPGFVSYGQNCYYIEKAQSTVNYRSWFEAVFECESRGATLASFHSIEECDAIVTAIGGGSHNLFIGLSSDGYSGWKWADDTGVDFFNWVPGEPNGQDRGEDCVEMYPWDGRWNDVDCFNERGYICKKTKDFSSCGSVEPGRRIECGYVAIEEALCLRRSCCWDPTYVNDNFSGCYYPEGINGPSGQPITEPTDENGGGNGLSTGAIIGIVVAILAVVLIGGAVFFCSRKSDKDLSLPSLPTWNSGSSSAKSKTKSGFENPVVTMNVYDIGLDEESAS